MPNNLVKINRLRNITRKYMQVNNNIQKKHNNSANKVSESSADERIYGKIISLSEEDEMVLSCVLHIK